MTEQLTATHAAPRKAKKDKRLSPGAPTLYGTPMKQTALFFPAPMIDWLKGRDATMSAYVRELVQREMERAG